MNFGILEHKDGYTAAGQFAHANETDYFIKAELSPNEF
jgi:hypothetical protein